MAILYIFQAFSWWFFIELCAGMGKAGSRSNPGQNAAIPIGIALKILVSAARCQRKARLWKLSQKNGWPLVLTATTQFNAENGVFWTVRAKIWRKLLIRTRCRLKSGENCALRGWNCAYFAVQKFLEKKRKISRNFKSEGFFKWRKKYKTAVSILIKHSGLTALVRKGWATSIFPLILGMGLF